MKEKGHPPLGLVVHPERETALTTWSSSGESCWGKSVCPGCPPLPGQDFFQRGADLCVGGDKMRAEGRSRVEAGGWQYPAIVSLVSL